MATSDTDNVARAIKKMARRHIQRSARPKSKLSSRVSWLVEMIALGCADIAIGIVLIVLATGLKIYAMWPMLVYGGVALFGRFLFMLSIPMLKGMANLFVPIINALLMGMTVVVNAGITALDALLVTANDLINIVNAIDKGITGHKLTDASFSLVKWVNNIPQITYSEYTHALDALGATCPQYDSMPKIVEFFMKYSLHDYTCPATRELWPLPTFYSMSETSLGWSYYGDAMPNPHREGANCMAANDVTIYDVVCSGMGIGYVCIEFFFPSVVLFIVVFAIGAGVWRLLRATLYALYLALETAIDIAVLFLDIVTI